ncbi:phospholipid carrier-dependent glycosyltransferase [Candidatus Woesearchaeota archaeon]|nr:phospholipid carrier-dependent glycosyltransferase [Candidatus Woesearchaeota archaeon]
MMRKIILKEWQIILCLFIIALVSRMLFISTSPNFWDSAEYMTKIRELIYGGNYDPASMSHNKPLYIGFGAGFAYLHYWITGNIDIEFALTLVSVIFGSLSIVMLYYLCKNIGFNRRACIISALIFAFIPITWWFSEEALSDIPAMFFLIAGIAFLFRWYNTNDYKWLLISCLLTGFGLLVRFANIFIISVYVIVYGAHFYTRYYQRHPRYDKGHYITHEFTGKINRKSITSNNNPINDVILVCTITLTIFLPLAIYILIEMLRNKDLALRYFFTSPPNVSFTAMLLFDRFNLLGMGYYILNSFTLALAGMAIMGGYYYFKEITCSEKRYNKKVSNKPDNLGYKADKKTTKCLPDISYKLNGHAYFLSLVVWLAVFLVYYLGIFRPISRYTIAFAPVFAVFAGYCLAERVNERMLVFMLFAGIIDIFLNYLDISEVYYGSGLRGMMTLEFVDVKFMVFASVILAAFYIYFRYQKYQLKPAKYGNRDKASILAISMLIIILIMHSYPVLNLVNDKVNYQKAIGIWYKENTADNSMIISGQEYPYDVYYGYPRNIKWYKPVLYEWEPKERSDYKLLKNEIIAALEYGRRVFTSSDRYIKPLVPMLEKDFSVKSVGLIKKSLIRNQYDWGAVFMNYAGMSRAEDIEMYEISKKI